MKLKKRIAALLMAGTMICSAFPVNVLALENSNQNTGGLCEHHTEHDADCGYTEGSEGTPCTHEHNEGCYTLVTKCVHEHTEDCYPEESVSDNTATPSDAEDQEPTGCKHQCSEESGCITKKLDCKHEHDEDCGYSPAEPGTSCTYVCEICSSAEQSTDSTEQKLVTEWTWKLPEPAENLTDDRTLGETEDNLPLYRNGRWELTLPATSVEHPLTKEQVIELLPQEIDLTWEEAKPVPGENENDPTTTPGENDGGNDPTTTPTKAGAVQLSLLEDKKTSPPADGEQGGEDGSNLPADEQQSKPNQAVAALTWEIADYPEQGAFSGEFVATASLPRGYRLKEDAVPLQLFLSFRNREGVSLEVLRGHELDTTLSPAGTKINLFDYWLSDREEDRRNSDHQPLGYDGDPNKENHDEDLKEDIERKSKGINKGHVLKFISWGGNWQGYNYWTGNVNPYEEIVAKQLDKNGYPEVDKEPKDFTWSDYNNNIYDTEHDKVGSLDYLFNPNKAHSGKASFENVKNLLQIDDKGYYYYDAGKNYARFDEETNEFILYDAPAIYRNNTDDPNPGQFFPFQTENQVCAYYKGGKDDGTLELDDSVNPASDRVNHYFGMTMETRFVHKNGGRNYQGQDITYEFTGDDDVWVFIDGVLIADLGGIHDKASFDINFHTGKIFVNGALKSTIKDQFVAAGEDGDKKFSGNTFADNTYHTLKFFFLERGNHESNMSLRYNLLPIPESELIKVDQMGEPVAGVEFTMYTADENYGIKEKIFTGTTDEKGYIYLRDEFGIPMTFAQFYDEYGAEYFVLKENEPAPGYRKLKDIHLHYKIYNKEKNIGIIESDENNLWETGACAQVKVTTTAPNKIRYGNFNNSGQVGELDLTNTEAVPNDPLMFAVVFQKNGDVWYPMSGDALSGWKVAPDNNWESVFAAVQENSYLFHLETSGAFQVEIENLPGNIEEYYSFLAQYGQKDQAKYYVAYYYSTADDLHQVTAENTYLILNQFDPDATYKDFTREFASRLYVPNIKNSLLVHKMDEQMQALNGAAFCLYEADEVNINDDGSYTINANATPYDEATTNNLTAMNGGIVFPSSSKVLEMGVYYLIETEAPEGYEKNPKAVKVIVDESGVYADAGSENDDIWVARSIGMIVRSMLQFAADDHVNSTLHDLKAQLRTADNYDYANTEWSEWQQSPASKDEMHLQYEEDDPVLDYGLIESEKDEHEFPALVTATGWSKLEIRQCREHDDDRLNSGSKQDLDDRDLTNLFSGLTTVIVRDDTDGETGKLTVSKTVDGSAGDKTKDWNFTVTLSDTSVNGTYGDMTFTAGVASFTLKHGESKTASNLPINITYAVVEQEANQDGYTTTSTGVNGTITENETTAFFVNAKDDERPDPDKGNLQVTKYVTGSRGDYSRDFPFEVELSDKTISGIYGDMTFQDGVSNFTLRDNESKTATGLPTGISYTVTETDAYGHSVSYSGRTGTIPHGGTASAIITNRKTGGGYDEIDVTVKKVWKLDDGGQCPESVRMELLRNGEHYDQVTLNEDNNWRYTWRDLDDSYNWSVQEANVPDGFTSTVDRNGMNFTITNDDKPDDPDTPTGPEEPTDNVPKTGDETHLALWLTLLGISGIGIMITLLSSKHQYKGKHDKKQ